MSRLQSQQSQATTQRHLYSIKQLATLASASAASMLLLSSDYVFQSSLGGASRPLAILGITLYLLVIATILVADWRGFLTMNGFLRWRSMRGLRRFTARCFFVAFNAFFLSFYLVQAYLTYRRYRQLAPLRLRRKIAEQEAELGIIPRTDGNCRRCHHPLQVGAEFCAYCRERVTERPGICPECYATTLPDARWCPTCGAQLEITVLSH